MFPDRHEGLVVIRTGLVIVLGLYASSLYSYLLFHTLVEIATITIGFTLFILARNARSFLTNAPLNILGIGFGFVAILDLLHTLAYKGMNVFPGQGANLPTQLWIAARGLQAATLCAAPICVGRTVDGRVVLGIYSGGLSVVAVLIYAGYFPDCYVEGKGLTPFKIACEYLIIAVSLVALHLFRRARGTFNGRVYALLVSSIVCAVAAEFSFTTYLSVYGFSNLLGHLFKFTSFYLIYRALLVTGFREPYELIFRELHETKEAYRLAHDHLEEQVRARTAELEQRVAERTIELVRINDSLSGEIVERLRAEEALHAINSQLERANLRLKEIDRLKSMFIASVSHELRTPLNSVIGYSRILHNEWAGTLGPKQKDILANVLKAGNHLISLVNDVIDVSKIEAGMIETEIATFDVAGVVSDAIETFATDIAAKRLELKVHGAGGMVQTDRTRLLQCLLNLLSNAVKFTEKGGIDVCVATTADRRMLELSVSDTGVGIRDDELHKLFSPFVRLDTPLTATVPGAGLGLYLTGKLVREVLGGEITVESVAGEGSRFSMRIPLVA